MDIDYTLVVLRTLERQVLYVCKCGKLHESKYVNIKCLIFENEEKYGLGVCHFKAYIIINCEKYPVFILITKWKKNGLSIMKYINWLQKSGYEGYNVYTQTAYENMAGYIDVANCILIPSNYRFDVNLLNNNLSLHSEIDDAKVRILIQKMADVGNFYQYCIDDIKTALISINPNLDGINFRAADVSENVIKLTNIGTFLHSLFDVWFRIETSFDNNFMIVLNIFVGSYQITLNNRYFVDINYLLDGIVWPIIKMIIIDGKLINHVTLDPNNEFNRSF